MATTWGLGPAPVAAVPSAHAAARATAAAASDEANLSALIDQALDEPFLADARVGVSVLDLETGQTLYQRADTVALNPASNVKLVTTASALAILGPQHRYVTAVYRKDGALAGSTVKGNVYLQGGGDPALVTANLYELAGRLRAQGIKRITGGIVVDSSRFDRDELPPGFDQKQEIAAYRAPGGATSVNFNTFVVHVRPGDTLGAPPFAGLAPPAPGLTLTLDASTVEGHRRQLFADLKPADGAISIKLRGKIGVDTSPTSYRYPVAEPSMYAGHMLALALKAQGIRLGRSAIKTGKVPRDAPLLGRHQSAPLSVLIRAINKFSNNFMAEQVLKTIDADPGPATFDGALAREREQLRAWGIPLEGMQLGNGSGLYDTNRVSPAQLTALLAAVYQDLRIRPDYLASLAIMGVDGTTRSRLRETPAQGWIRVKTGTLDGVSALSGYVAAPGRKPIVFSILLNGMKRSDTSKARKVQDRIAQLLAQQAAGEPLVLASKK